MPNSELNQVRELAKAFVLLVKNDNTGTNNLHSFVQDRVINSFSPVGSPVQLPEINFEVVLDDKDGNLPSEHGELRLEIRYPTSKGNYVGDSAKVAGRINFLINEKPSALTAENSNLKCRLCDRISQYPAYDDSRKTYFYSMIFKVILGI